MISKSAISIFNPQHPVEAAFQDAYHAASGRWMTAADMRVITRCIPAYRGLANKVHQNAKTVARMLFGERNDSNVWYYPCDVLELRSLLSSKKIAWHAPVMLFGPKAARRLMSEYPVCLVFDRNVAKQGRTFGGVHVRDSNQLDLSESLNRVMIRDYLDERQANTIYRILKECVGYLPAYLLTDVPGISGGFEQRKVAETEQVHQAIGEKKMSMGNWYTRMKTAKIDYPEPPEGVQEAVEAAADQYQHTLSWRELAESKSKHVEAAGPSETFGREFTIGKQPQIPDPEIVRQVYQKPHVAMSVKKGDRVAYRYTDIKLPVNNHSRSMPMTRSLTQTPKSGTVELVDHEHIHVLWDGAKEVQKVPVDAHVFLIRVGE